VPVAVVELACLLALGHHRAVAGAGEEGRDPGAAGAQALGQGALGIELELEFAAQVLALELLVLADVGRDHLADLPSLEQLAEAEAVHARVVGDDGEVLHARIAQRGDQRLGDAAQAEAADREGLAVGHHVGERAARVGVALGCGHGILAPLVAPILTSAGRRFMTRSDEGLAEGADGVALPPHRIARAPYRDHTDHEPTFPRPPARRPVQCAAGGLPASAAAANRPGPLAQLVRGPFPGPGSPSPSRPPGGSTARAGRAGARRPARDRARALARGRAARSVAGHPGGFLPAAVPPDS